MSVWFTAWDRTNSQNLLNTRGAILTSFFFKVASINSSTLCSVTEWPLDDKMSYAFSDLFDRLKISAIIVNGAQDISG